VESMAEPSSVVPSGPVRGCSGGTEDNPHIATRETDADVQEDAGVRKSRPRLRSRMRSAKLLKGKRQAEAVRQASAWVDSDDADFMDIEPAGNRSSLPLVDWLRQTSKGSRASSMAKGRDDADFMDIEPAGNRSSLPLVDWLRQASKGSRASSMTRGSSKRSSIAFTAEMEHHPEPVPAARAGYHLGLNLLTSIKGTVRPVPVN